MMKKKTRALQILEKLYPEKYLSQEEKEEIILAEIRERQKRLKPSIFSDQSVKKKT
jgi:hypothetical protein